MESNCLNPAIVADLEFIKDEVLEEIRPFRKSTDKSPQTLAPQRVPKPDCLVTRPRYDKRDPQGVHFRGLDGGRLDTFMLDSATAQCMGGGRKEFTTATSSRTDGIDTEGTNTAHWIRLSWPRISAFSADDSRSVIRAVERKQKKVRNEERLWTENETRTWSSEHVKRSRPSGLGMAALIHSSCGRMTFTQ